MLDRRVNPNSREIKKNSENEYVHISYILRNSISKGQIKFEPHPNKCLAEITQKSTKLKLISSPDAIRKKIKNPATVQSMVAFVQLFVSP